MGRILRGKSFSKQIFDRSIRHSKADCELLEDRKLMSLTIEVRAADGSSSATATAVGEVFNLEVLGIVSDSTNMPRLYGLEDIAGSFVSSASQGHAVAGSLLAANVPQFDASGAIAGTQEDINGDGNIDDGGPAGDFADQFFARSSGVQGSAHGTIVGNTLQFEIGTLTYTVTSLNKGGATDINFVPYNDDGNFAGYSADWIDNSDPQFNGAEDNLTSTFQAGTPYVVNDPALIVAPVAVDDSVTAVKNTPLDINELANDDIIVALNPSSVVIVTNAAHGTTALQNDGSILYTPTANYLGDDSFTYHVADTDGRVSNTATVNIAVKLAPPPVAVAVSATTLRNQAVSVDVASMDTSATGTITKSSVMVVTAPGNGTAVAESDGTILYTPRTAFVGTDSFTYTVADSNDETSNPGTVTVTVTTPIPPVAVGDQFTMSEGAPLSLNVLANDMAQSAALVPSTVTIGSAVQHGTTSVGPDGSVLYTPIPGYLGTDAFTYTVADVLGNISNVATVSLIIGADVPPVATTTSAYALAGAATTVDISSVVSSGAPLVASTATLVTAPVDGTLANSGGSFIYTPNAGFVGSDSFTFNVDDVNGVATATPGTVNIFVGAAVGSKGAAAHSLTFVDSEGGSQSVSINSGTANVYFSGTGTLATAKNGKATISGQSNLQIANIVLNDTNKSSTFSIKGLVTKPVTIGGVTDESALGTFSAPSAILTNGDAFDGGLGSLKVASISNDAISVGAGSTGKFSLAAGTVLFGSLSSQVPITSIKVTSWTTGGILAPSIGTITSGPFDIDTVQLTSKGVDLVSAKINGALNGGWTLDGSAGTISATSAGGTFAPTIGGALNSMTFKTGGFQAPLVAGSIGTLSIGGDLTGPITTASAKSIKITGGASGATLKFTGAAGVKTLSIGGAVSNENITSVGNIGALTVGSLSGTNIDVGVTNPDVAAIVLADAPLLGSAVISSLKVTSKASGAFTNSAVSAGKITSAAIGSVTTSNSGTAFGLATKSISSFSASFANGPVHLGAAQLKSETILQLYLTQQAIIFSDFELGIDG